MVVNPTLLTTLPGGIELGGPFGRLLIAIIVLLVVVLVGRLVLAIAWRLLLFAGLIIGVLYVVSLFVG